MSDWTEPLYATPRDPGRFSDGARVAIVADALGTPLMAWQRYVADVATERNPDGSYAYPVVVVTVPRQSGKTTLMRAIGVERCMVNPDFGCFYTAQTGKDARERWQDLVKQVKGSPFRSRLVIRQAAGSERLVFPNGSAFRCFAPVATSLHGYTPPLVMLDEAFAHSEATGEDLMGAIGPAQITLRNRQLWIVSTAGTGESVFLRRWVDAGRAGQAGVAHFEWAAGPDVDVFDSEAWLGFHPAVGTPDQVSRGVRTITVDAIAAEANRLSAAEFARAYGNRWTRTASNVIPEEHWTRMGAGTGDVPAQRPPAPDQARVLAYDVAHDRQSAVAVVTWVQDGKPTGRVLQAGPGAAWLADAVMAYRAQHPRVTTVAALDDGPVREVNDALTRHGVKVLTLATKDVSIAWGDLVTHVREQTATHDGSALLADSATSVVTRRSGDVSIPSRHDSPGDAAPVLAYMAGVWALERRPAPSGPPVFHFAE